MNRRSRTPFLIAEFPRFLRVFEQNPPFKRYGQLEYHLETIQRRRELGSASKAINDDQFVSSLYKTLQAWGIGIRASNLKPFAAFADALRVRASEIAALENVSIDDPTLDAKVVGELWRLIDTLDIVTNKTRIVPGSKTLHHLLPELVVPIDRAYTQKFFGWQNPKFQYEQALCFEQAFAAFSEIARGANPVQFITDGWNSSRTKIIDNALVGMLCEEGEVSSPSLPRRRQILRMARDKAKIAIAAGDPAGIGPEISIKAALDPRVRNACNPVVVSDPGLIERHAKACSIAVDLRVVARITDAAWSDSLLNVLDCAQPESRSIEFGTYSAASGRASLAFAAAAIRAALAGEVDAVVAAPQNETSIALAGIAFDGYPSFVARETGTDPDDVYLMLCCKDVRIVHATLHQSVRQAIELITREKVVGVIRAADRAVRKLGIDAPQITVGGLNPHAGEGGLFGREEIEIIGPAIETARAQGITARGPFGADTMFHMPGVDAFVVMLHDQGHIAAKLLAPNATAALTIGSPILFSSVAHGSAHDIAGRGIADPAAMIEALLRLSSVGQRLGSQPARA